MLAIINTTLGLLSCNLLAGGVRECLGIPYALAPTGERRFRPPTDAADAWTGTRAATAFGPSCPQYSMQLYNVTGLCSAQRPANDCSEDCLSLNVWSPPRAAGDHDDRSRLANATELPVFFWVHGGGCNQGGSSEFNGTALAAKHGVVVVTTNYRLGALGFLALEQLEDGAAANNGLLDQQSAMRWSQKHFASFGGAAQHTLLSAGSRRAAAA